MAMPPTRTTSCAGATAYRAPSPAPRCAAAAACSRRCCCAGRTPTRCCAARFGRFPDHLQPVRDVIGLREGARTLAAMQMLMLPERQLFICDTHVNRDPSAEQVAEIALLAAEEVRRFGITPSVALLSHSSFGSSDAPSAQKMRAGAGDGARARARRSRSKARCAATRRCRRRSSTSEFPDSGLTDEANVLVMPNVDAANISYNLLRIAAGRASRSAASCSARRCRRTS